MRAGGKERRLLELIRYLKEKTNYKLVLVLMGDEIHYDYVNDFGIKIYRFRKKYYRDPIFLSWQLFKICKKENAEILNVWGIFPALNSLLTKILLNIKLVNCSITSAYNNLQIFSLIYILTKLTLLYSDKVIANSNAGLKSFRVVSKNSIVIYNGINLNRMVNLIDKEKIKINYGIETEFNIVMVATFNDDKDYDLLLDTAKMINKINMNIGFILLGDGVNYKRIKKRVEFENIENIYQLGRVSGVESIVNFSDIGVLLSPNGEGISNAIMEYMLLGKPVIATNIGGNPEIVEDGKNGYLVENRNVEDLKNKILKLNEDIELYKKMRNFATETVKNNFNIELMGEKFDKSFRTLF